MACNFLNMAVEEMNRVLNCRNPKGYVQCRCGRAAVKKESMPKGKGFGIVCQYCWEENKKG